MKFSAVAATALCATAVSATPIEARTSKAAAPRSPFTFTSTFHVAAIPAEVVNNTNFATGGLAGAYGVFDLGLNSFTDTICYNISFYNVRGNYSSPAATATHIHQAVRGQAGPPRIAFPNPVGNDTYRNAVGCLKGPFRTGLNGTDGRDTGTGFTVKQIEAAPASFFADTHTSLAVPGAIRGQIA